MLLKLSHSNRVSKQFLKYTGVFSALLGLLVIIGWYSHNVTLIQINEAFVPMQYNTALGFLLIGIAVITLALKQKATTFTLGIFVSLLGALTLFEYIFGVDFQIDQLYMEHYVTVKTSHPGRMAPNTALNFLLCGLFVSFSVSKFDSYNFKINTLILIAVLIFSLSLTAFLGYLFSFEEAYGWHQFTRMAVHTSFGFLILSIGMLGNTFFVAHKSVKKYWLPITFPFMIFLIFNLFSQAIIQEEHTKLKKNIQIQGDLIAEQIKLKLKENEKSLRRMTQRFVLFSTSRGVQYTQKEWMLDAEAIQDDLYGVMGLRKTDKEHYIKWIYPPIDDPKKLQSKSLIKEEYRKEAVLKSMREKRIVATHSLDLRLGGKGFLLLSPIYLEDQFFGHFFIAYRISDLFSKILPFIDKENFIIDIIEDGKLLYSSKDQKNLDELGNAVVYNLNDLGFQWQLVITPTKEYLEKEISELSNLILFLGVSIALMMGIAFFLLQLKKENESMAKQLFEQSKMVAMGEMIGNIAHQWRQPLSIISTSATGLKFQKEFNTLSDEQLLKSCDIINENAQYLSQTIDNFRNFIKGDENFSIITIDQVLKNVLSLTSATIQNNYITLISDIDLDLKINGSLNELSEAFINIINNSKDVLKERVKVQEDRLLFIEVKPSINKSVIIRFRDSGGGIPEEILDRIFEPYFTSKHQSIGTGLGLSMAEKIIREKHHGSIQAANTYFEHNGKKYKGAEFKVEFVLHQE